MTGSEVRLWLRRAREVIGDDPRFLPVVLRATPRGLTRQLTDETEIVIEGMPRSGNTFAVHALAFAQGRAVPISSHVHTPSAVKAAVGLKLPTLVVIREPVDTVASLIIAAPHVTPAHAVREWVHHYTEIWPLREQFVVATFDEVIADFGAVTARVNERFGTSFARFDPSDANTAAVFEEIDRNHQRLHGGTEHVVPRPSEDRRAKKAALLERLRHPDLDLLWSEADVVYDHYCRLAKG